MASLFSKEDMDVLFGFSEHDAKRLEQMSQPVLDVMIKTVAAMNAKFEAMFQHVSEGQCYTETEDGHRYVTYMAWRSVDLHMFEDKDAEKLADYWLQTLVDDAGKTTMERLIWRGGAKAEGVVEFRNPPSYNIGIVARLAMV